MSEASVTEKDNHRSENALNTLDIKVLCDIASKGDRERICALIVSNTQEDAFMNKTKNGVVFAEALFDFFFHGYLNIKQQIYLPMSKGMYKRLDRCDDNDKINNQVFEEGRNCILTNQHIVQENPNLILRSLLFLPPWNEIPW